MAKLISLRGVARLNTEETKVAQTLLRALKEQYGLSDKKIEQLTEGRWKASTSKYYTKGVKTTSSLVPKTISGAFAEMIARGLDLDKVAIANQIQRRLGEQGVPLEDVLLVISITHNAGISLETLVSIFKEVKKSGIPIGDLGQTFSYRKSLDALNIDNKSLGKLIETVRKIGNLDDTMAAITAFSQLTTIEVELQAKSSAKQILETEVQALTDFQRPAGFCLPVVHRF